MVFGQAQSRSKYFKQPLPHCLRPNLVNLSPDDHCLRGEVCGEFYSRSWRAVFGESTLRMFALVFITVTWLIASFMCAREAVVWGIICLPSWTKVASCLHDGLKRTQWDVDFKNPLGNFGFPEEVKSSLRPQINIFLFIYLFFQSKALRADFEDTFTLIRKNSLATTEGWLIRLTLTCVFRVSRYTVRNAQVAKAELWIDTWLKSAAKLGTRVV